MSRTEIQVLKKDTAKYRTVIWSAVVAIIMTIAALLAFYTTWTGIDIRLIYLICAAFAGEIFASLAGFLARKNRFAWLIIIIPCAAVFMAAGWKNIENGLWMWADDMIKGWNRKHDGGAALVTVIYDLRSAYAFSILVSVIIGEMVYYISMLRRPLIYGIFCLIFVIPGLLTGHESVTASGLMVSIMFAMLIAGRTEYITWRSVLWSIGIGIMLTYSAHLAAETDIAGINNARTSAVEFIHDVRYGHKTLPEGSLHNADKLTYNDEKMLSVWCGQEKNTYLKGFVGAIYKSETGEWKAFPSATYGGDNSGMLKWLESRNFDPLKQVSEYYSLCDEADRPEPSRLTITVSDASRDFAYLPSSVDEIVLGRIKGARDMNFTGKGIRGAKSYTIDEISSSRPSELAVTGDWVLNPQTEAQKEYVEAEAVYRNFVYENYTKVDASLYSTLDELFWSDYDAENDGIYSAVSHLRNVMKEHLSYNVSNDIPDDEEPVSWFLKKSGSGNAVMYATTAVLALRVHGIPARYVEGYYIPETMIAASDDGKVILTGANSHAWVEVYFDGTGWLPIDVTPGYYYDAVALQQMVGRPDNVNKTAAYDDSKENQGQIIESDGAGKGGFRDVLNKAGNIAKYALGVIAILIIILTLIIVITEIARLIRISVLRRKFDNAGPAERAAIIEKWMYRLMAHRGIDAALGWNTHKVDTLVSDRFDNIEPGSYARCCSIIEKSVYGGMEPEPYEERTLTLLVSEMASVQKRDTLAERIRLRYIIFKR